jgi:HAD superfamily hydrolase (TIGR01509 family)
MDFASYYGRTDVELWKDFIAKHHPPQTFEQLLAWKQRCLIELLHKRQPIFPDVVSLLEKLEPHYSLAVASGSNHAVINEVLSMRHLCRFFPIVVSVQDVPRGKPAPDVFLRTAGLLQVRPHDCCVIEDSIAGIEASLAAKMKVIAITNTLPKEKLSRATHIVSSYDQIESILLP